MAAILARRMLEHGVLLTREQFADLDDQWLINVVFRPDFHQGNAKRGYWPMPRVDSEDQPTGPAWGPKHLWYETTGKNMRTLGFSEEDIDARYLDWRKDIVI